MTIYSLVTKIKNAGLGRDGDSDKNPKNTMLELPQKVDE